jgi:hypothetical protein
VPRPATGNTAVLMGRDIVSFQLTAIGSDAGFIQF